VYILELYNRIKWSAVFPSPKVDSFPHEREVREFDSLEIDERNGSFLLNETYTIYDLKLGGVSIPLAVMQVTGNKNLVKTPLAGQAQDVIEIIGFQGYEIAIAGMVVDYLGSPEDKIYDLNQLFRKNEALEVECDFLAVFDIHFVVIENFVVTPPEGVENVIGFEFKCHSDQPIELELRNGILPVL
jgi:hypothetical protein